MKKSKTRTLEDHDAIEKREGGNKQKSELLSFKSVVKRDLKGTLDERVRESKTISTFEEIKERELEVMVAMEGALQRYSKTMERNEKYLYPTNGK